MKTKTTKSIQIVDTLWNNKVKHTFTEEEFEKTQLFTRKEKELLRDTNEYNEKMVLNYAPLYGFKLLIK